MLPQIKVPEIHTPQWGIPESASPLGIRSESRAMVYYVDKTNPLANNANDGVSPLSPLLTIQAAITKSNAQIDWGDAFGGLMPHSWIIVGPGVYAENLTPAYYCHIVGTGILGTDTATEIHPTTGSALAGTGLGLHLFNLWFESETAVPVLNFGVCNNTIIEQCVIAKGIAGLATIGIEFDNASHVQIRRCSFESGVAAFARGIVANGGANKYLHNCRIEDNRIFAVTDGILIAVDCTATQTVIKDNVIALPAAGINDLSADTYCVNNYITATDAIVHANSATMCIANHVINNGVGAVEAAGTS
jgi:hypothetical protein